MKAKYEKIGKSMVHVTVELEAGRFDEAVNQAYRREVVNYHIPGLRKGMAPRKLIEKMYGETIFFGAAADILIAEEFQKAVDKLGLEAVSGPENLEIHKIGLGEAFVFSADVAVMPEAVLGRYKGIEIDRIYPEINEAEIENALNQLQYEASQQIPVTDRPATYDDTANIDFVGMLDGVPFDGGAAQGYEIVLGSGLFIPGFEDQIIGRLPGEEFDVFVTFPEDYGAAELAGKPAVFGVKLNGLFITEAPDIDDAFARNFGMASLEMLKDALRESLMEGKTKEVKTQMENKIMDIVLDNAEVELPEVMVRYALERDFEELKAKLEQNGISMEAFLANSGKSVEEYLEEQRPDTVKQLKLRAVLVAVAKAENITVDENELEAELQRIGEQYNITADRVREVMGDTEPLRRDLAAGKSFNLIVNSAVIK